MMGINPHALYLDLQDDLSRRFGRVFVKFYLDNPHLGPAPDASPSAVAAIQLLRSFYKKFVDQAKEGADSAALAKFLQVNSACKNWSVGDLDSWDLELVGELRKHIYNFWNKEGYPIASSLDEILFHGRCGPGASLGANGNDFYTKLFSSRLSCTSSYLYVAYKSHVSNYPDWVLAEFQRSTQYGSYYVVEGNRLSFVPKTVDISRSICTEPNLNMFYQLGLGRIIEHRLKEVYGIDFSKQPEINRELARLGSLGLGLCTIDLSSASDSMALSMLEAFLPRDFIGLLKGLRSKTSLLPTGEQVELHMVSTMGNGFTFPLQTMLFSCVVAAAHSFLGFPLNKWGSSRNFGVFGDDIICSNSVVRVVLRLLRILGFEVNPQKTFVEGHFRESCGGDFYMGHLVRGVYLKSLDSQHSRYVAINLLNQWSSISGIWLPSTVQTLLKSVRFLPVPPWENNECGIKVPFSMVRHLRVRKDLQSVVYRRLEPFERKVLIKDCRVIVPLGSKKRSYNPSGLLLSFLAGYIVSNSFSVRHDSVRFRPKLAVAPNWDYGVSKWDPSIATIAPIAGAVDWQRWNTAVHYNHVM